MAVQQTQPYNVQLAVQPDDSADLARFTSDQHLTGAIYVGVGGDVVVVTQNNQSQLYKNVPSGTLLTVAARRVNATNTTALNMLALYVV
jgi:hypothetical protein